MKKKRELDSSLKCKKRMESAWKDYVWMNFTVQSLMFPRLVSLDWKLTEKTKENSKAQAYLFRLAQALLDGLSLTEESILSTLKR